MCRIYYVDSHRPGSYFGVLPGACKALKACFSHQVELPWCGYRKYLFRLSHDVAAYSIALITPEERAIIVPCWAWFLNVFRGFLRGLFFSVLRRSRPLPDVCCSNWVCLGMLCFIRRLGSPIVKCSKQNLGNVVDSVCPARQATDFIPRLANCASICLFVFYTIQIKGKTWASSSIVQAAFLPPLRFDPRRKVSMT